MNSQTTWASLRFWNTPIFEKIQEHIRNPNVRISPSRRRVFRPLIQTPLSKVRVVIVAKEPYHIPYTADGLAISCFPDVVTRGDCKMDFSLAPMLLNRVINEALSSKAAKFARTTDLSCWAKQGVLLWNATPTVVEGCPNSHKSLGWGHLTKEILETVYLVNPDTVFVFIDDPAEDYRGVLPEANSHIFRFPSGKIHGSGIFNNINEILQKTGQKRVNWNLKG